MLDALTLFIDRLKNGSKQLIEGSFAPDFLELDEPELKCAHPVVLRLEAYIAEEHLVLHFSASTMVAMPCAICNAMILHPIRVENVVVPESLSDMTAGTYDVSPAVREALLIELPRTVECNQGRCPARVALEPYLRSQARVEQTTHFPFSDLEIKP